MTNFYGIGSSGINTLFGTSNSNVSSTSFLTDYYSIKSGSYKKLLTAYYAKNGEKTSINTSNDSSKKLVSIKEVAEDLSKTAGDIVKQGRNSVFAKDEDGKYDIDKITKSIKKFVEDYNTVIEATEESNTSSIASNASSMIRMTDANEGLFEKLGIKINEDFTLKLDEDTLKEADMNVAKTLFSGTGSYAYNIYARASMIQSNADTEISRANTYSAAGSYNYNYSMGDIYNAYL